VRRQITHLRVLAAGLGICLAIGVIACGNGPPQGSPSSSGPPVGTIVHNVPADTMVMATDGLVFTPVSATVKVGGVLEFNNSGSVFHNITFAGHGELDQPNFPGGATWEIKFTTAGTYPFVCTIHAPNMKGSVTVT
jgi:plastocyanin